jgi:hypothetical protein
MMCRVEEMPWAIFNQALKTQKPNMTPWLMATICRQVICFPKLCFNKKPDWQGRT